MGIKDWFGIGGEVKKASEGVGGLAKDIRAAVTGHDLTLDAKLLELAGKADELAGSMVQAELTGNWLQRSWRPILALVCILSVFVEYILGRFIPLQEAIVDPADLWPVLLGLITYRSYEKTQGIRGALGQK